MSESRPVATASPMPRVAAVLLNWHAEAESDTAACIRSLQASDYPALEIVLVDNGCPQDVVDRLAAEFEGVHVIRTGANLGFAGGNNRGISYALERGSDYVLVLNNDTVVEPDCVRRLVRAACTSERVGAVGGKILYYDRPDRVWFGGGWFSEMRGLGRHRGEGEPDPNPEGGPPEEVTFLTGCCMLLPAAVLREVGFFEEDFFVYVEDVELCVRLAQAGYRLLYDPSARVYHRVPLREPEPPCYKIMFRDRNRRRLARRRLGFAARLRFAAFFYSTRLLYALRYLARGDMERLGAIWQGMTAR